jgi:pilus assembly protein CpaB
VRINTLVTLGASAAFGIMAIVLARGWIEGAVENEFSNSRVATPTAQAVPMVDTMPIVVADIPLNFGDVLSYENLRLVDMPDDIVPQGSYSSIDELLDDVSQQTVALSRMSYNEPVLGFKISGPGGRGSLSSLIAEGKRATAIRVTDVAGVAGFVLPGDNVDIIYTRDAQTRRGADSLLLSDVLLQNVKVLGIDQDLNNQSATPSVVNTVTVEVSNEDAQKLHLAMDAGNLSLTLRRVGELEVETQRRITSSNLVSAPKRKAQGWRKPSPAAKLTPPEPVDKVANITIIRGEDRDEVSVAMEEGALPVADAILSDELAGG